MPRWSLSVFAIALLPMAALAQTIQSIEVNQSIGVQKGGALKFVAGRDTVVRAFLDLEATVDAAQTDVVVSRDGQPVITLTPNKYDAPTRVVDFQCPSRQDCGNWAAGSYTFVAKVNGQTKSTEGTTYLFQDRGALRILAVPVKANYKGAIVSVTDERWKTFGDYLRKTYPLAPDKIDWSIREEFDGSAFDLETDDGQRNLWEALEKLIPARCAQNPLAEGCFHQVFGFIMDRPKGYPNGTLQGYTFGKPANIGVVRDEDAEATVAHEIGHTFGLGDTYNGGSFHCIANPSPDSFTGKDFNDASKQISCSNGRTALTGVGGTLIPAAHHPYEIGGRGALADSAEYMGSGGKQAQFWTTQDAWDHLFDKFTPAAAAVAKSALAVPERFIQVFGQIRENATSASDVTLEPWWSYEDTVVPTTSTGKYMVVAINAIGTRIASQQIKPVFDPVGPKGLPSTHLTIAPFSEEVRFPVGTVKFQILNNDAVVREIPVSANSPIVTNVGTQLSGLIAGTQTITWTATDMDGGPLTYEVEYNGDITNPQSDWDVLTRELTEARIVVDFGKLPGGTHAKIRVTANDGINAGNGESAEFSVAAKAPELFIGFPLAGAIFAPRREITFDAEAVDIQDDDIDTSEMEWRSNLSGLLGKGSPLKVSNLATGIHTIEVSTTNYLGIRGSKSIQLVIDPTVSIDGNGSADALTDGLLLLRYFFGFRGATLINGAIGSGAQRTSSTQIEAYIESVRPRLDVDGNGSQDALTDGLLILRYLFGFRGTTLTNGAISAGATRTTPAAIEAYIQTLL